MENRNFLSVGYGEIGFLINKAQFFSSCYLEKEMKANSPIRFLNRIIDYGGERVLVFDLHEALRDLFLLKTEGKAQLLLIVRLEQFSEGVRKVLTRVKGGKNSISKDLLGLRIKSDARMETLSVGQLRLLPLSARNFLKEYGILACSFAGDATIQYLIEVDRICGYFIKSALQNRKGR